MAGPQTSTFAKIYESVRDQIINEITAGTYPAGALLPSIREIMQRWEVSTTTARRVLDELAAAGYARKEGTRGHISTGGLQQTTSATTGTAALRRSPAPVRGQLTVRPIHTLLASGSIHPNGHTQVVALDVRAEAAPAEAVLALRLTDPAEPVVVRRRLLADADGTPVQLATSYLAAHVAEGTALGRSEPIDDPWLATLASHTGGSVSLAASHITARHPSHDEAPALALPSDAAVLVREDIHHDHQGRPIDYTRTVWPGDTTRLSVSAHNG